MDALEVARRPTRLQQGSCLFDKKCSRNDYLLTGSRFRGPNSIALITGMFDGLWLLHLSNCFTVKPYRNQRKASEK